jgi:hypothetical protein
MIPVKRQPEPASFDKTVRQPGLQFVRDNPGKKLNPHWRKCIDDLWIAYSGVCAYMCLHIHRVTGALTVEHMIAKSSRVDLAYEWSNYRLVCSTLNGRKSDYDDVLDPFLIKDGWFVLRFPHCKVDPGDGLTKAQRRDVEKTIERLKLNDAKCLSERGQYLDNYNRGDTSFAFLQRMAPFIARELQRQGLRRPTDSAAP